MIRTLLATTALAGMLATSAFAQSPGQTTTAAPGAASPAPMTNDNPAATSAMTTDTASSTAAIDYVQRLEADQYLASRLTGTDLYETNAQDARNVGEIQNFVIGQDGKVAAVVVATSGLEENKTVAVPADRIDWINAENGDQRAVLKASLTDLQGAPAFTSNTAQEAANNGAMTPGTGAQTGANTDMAASGMAAGTAGQSPAASSATMGTQNGYLASLGNDQKLSEDVIGANVYSGPGDDAQNVGSVNDLVLTKTGEIPAVLVGVGGFLGIGEKNVGVPFQSLQMKAENGDNSDPRLVLAATKEQLTNAPTFDTGEQGTSNVASTATGVGTGAATGAAATGAMATDTTTSAQNTTSGGMMNADPSTTASTNNNDRSSMTPVTGPELTADNLNGVSVYGPNDQSIGKVGDIALTADGRVDAVVVDVGGFLGIGSKPVAVAMDNLQFMRDSNGNVNIYTQFSQDQLKNAPEFNRESYAQNRSSMRIEQGNAPAPTGNASGQTGSQPAQ
ncbi:PRC-barrel domain-containing protein [Aureimonas psammosilenae]|uniref:PRC-barrel domain-containing protein n=1 Tax=Aureimonas psammosilenae TaxID=2495496 RepID=UPI001260C465|nr:PRC-barrel domain-containing protein [Aureimonas psammosilenae]